MRLEDNSETSEQFAPQMILPEVQLRTHHFGGVDARMFQDRASPKSLTNTVHSSEGA